MTSTMTDEAAPASPTPRRNRGARRDELLQIASRVFATQGDRLGDGARHRPGGRDPVGQPLPPLHLERGDGPRDHQPRGDRRDPEPRPADRHRRRPGQRPARLHPRRRALGGQQTRRRPHLPQRRPVHQGDTGARRQRAAPPGQPAAVGRTGRGRHRRRHASAPTSTPTWSSGRCGTRSSPRSAGSRRSATGNPNRSATSWPTCSSPACATTPADRPTGSAPAAVKRRRTTTPAPTN